MLAAVASASLGYVAGLLPSADLIAKAVARSSDSPDTQVLDPRRAGSGNPGAANIANLLGRRAGAAVFTLDMGKALLAGQAGRALAGATGANVAASATVLGHCFPVTRGLRGGKGVAASFGQMLATFPAYLPVDLALGAVAAKSAFWKRRPVATIGATCGLWVALAADWTRSGRNNLWGPRPTAAMPIAAAVSAAAIVYRFRAEAVRADQTRECA